MKSSRVRLVLVAVTFVAVFALPTAATASQFVVERSLMGFNLDPPTYLTPDISGGRVIYGVEGLLGARPVSIFTLARGFATSSLTNSGVDIFTPAISGDWVVYGSGSDIHARNLHTGAYKAVTNDGSTKIDMGPSVSTADGAYVVWRKQSAGQWDVMGKNLAVNGSAFTIAGGTGNQLYPAIYGKRVAYLDDKNTGTETVWVKTIGSSAAPLHITDDGHLQSKVDIGDHLVAWLATNADGHSAVRYYDFNTGSYYTGPSNAVFDMDFPQVSGDRILYSVWNGSDWDLCVYDTRVAKDHPNEASFALATTTRDEWQGKIEGSQLTYLSDKVVYYAKLMVPSISLSSVPSRISRGGHIHLTGSISDLGHRIGGAKLYVEKYAAGKWTPIKLLTASTTGTFSYKTPAAHSKTKYRVVYNGNVDLLDAPASEHLSTVSAVKTAWPR